MRSQLARWYPVFLVLVAVAISLAVLPRLPERLAVHWDLQGNANGWMPRMVGAFFTPALILATWGVFRAIPSIDPRRENYDKFASAYDLTIAAALSLLFVTHIILLAVALGYDVPLRRVLPVLVGLMFLVIGNVMPRARSNFTFGIRTPWTLSNERVWASTHRIAGYAMAIAGLVTIFAGLFLSENLTVPVMLATVGVALIGPAAYSYFAWKREIHK